ncbi:reverse transcriptase domain-containing protein [Tanacetum coccineum]
MRFRTLPVDVIMLSFFLFSLEGYSTVGKKYRIYQAHPYQAPALQMQGVSKTDFENYVKANDAVLRNMQNQGQGLQNQMTNLTEMLSKFVNSNTASTSSSALADLGAENKFSCIFRVEKLNLPNLTPTCMTLELANRSISRNPIGIAKDVNVKVGVFQFPADFVVVDFEPDPRVPLILRRCFLKTDRALIDVYEGELTLRVGNEAITYKS